ncbi:hypothetical protein [Pedobacter sp.]|uniref:hypothetical protein n=1 Tax=Pedobacter sp. TaxID=1411316 RepID=UPI003D7FD38A
MTELAVNNPEFEVQINIDGTDQTILVKPEETSDGAAYYRCLLQGKQLTQIREDVKGEWEQLWGSLVQAKVNAIGKAIKEKQIS